ncbi:MAG: DUF4923 family protein [Muribaculaceae bacterium]|nr:DUF4923 family protein [Muribaculaceae bacterium]
MNKSVMKFLSACIIASSTFVSASAFDIKDLLNQAGQALENGSVTDIIEGVLSTSNLEVKDLAGVWTSTGSAVAFQSEDLLSQAGGVAMASTLESKINPYFTKYGIVGSVITIQTDGSFSMSLKKTTLKGKIVKGENNKFILSFEAFGKNNLGNVNLYIQKTSTSMDLMFDASKLKTILSSIASLSKKGLGNSLNTFLNSYNGICIGFKMSKTGKVEGESESSTSISDLFNKDKSSESSSSSKEEETEKGSVKDLFKKK